jgi:glycine cleavage system regulatory protein
MATLVLTAIGDDRAGLVSALADVIANHGGNWERSQMAELAGKFAGIVVVSVPDTEVERFTASLEPLADVLDVHAHVAAGDPPDGERIGLHLLGNDRPGIVRDLSQVLAAHGISIDELSTLTRDAPMTGGVLFEATAVLDLPAGTAIAPLRSALESLANELMVDIDIDGPMS